MLLLTDRLHPYIMVCHQASGPCYITKTVFLCDEIPVEKIRLSWDHLIITMGIPISIRPHLYIEMAPKVGYNRVCLISWYTINGEVTLGIMCLGCLLARVIHGLWQSFYSSLAWIYIYCHDDSCISQGFYPSCATNLNIHPWRKSLLIYIHTHTHTHTYIYISIF